MRECQSFRLLLEPILPFAPSGLTSLFPALQFQREGEPCKCYEQVPRTATEPGARELCDNCGKATPDLRRSCDNPACPLGGGDICLDCLNGESRWSGKPAVSASPLAAEHC